RLRTRESWTPLILALRAGVYRQKRRLGRRQTFATWKSQQRIASRTPMFSSTFAGAFSGLFVQAVAAQVRQEAEQSSGQDAVAHLSTVPHRAGWPPPDAAPRESVRSVSRLKTSFLLASRIGGPPGPSRQRRERAL